MSFLDILSIEFMQPKMSNIVPKDPRGESLWGVGGLTYRGLTKTDGQFTLDLQITFCCLNQTTFDLKSNLISVCLALQHRPSLSAS